MGTTFITGHRHYYSLLPGHMQKIYMNILKGFKSQRTNFSFVADKHNGLYPTTQILMKILDYVFRDNPLLYHVNRTNVQLYYSFASMGLVNITYTELYTAEERIEIEQQLYRRVHSILEYFRNQSSEYDKVHDLYRYILATVKYDHGFTKANTRRNLEDSTIIGPLLRGTAVCAGYSQAFKFLCDQLGILCYELVGKSGKSKDEDSHCWNIVNLNGQYYHTDVTFDSCHFHALNKYTYGYFLRSDKAMRADHQWDQTRFPPMPRDYSGPRRRAV